MNNLNTLLSERFAAFVSTLPKPVQNNIEASYKRGESFTAQAFEAGWMAAPERSDTPAARDAVLEEAALICDQQTKEPECPERAAYCAEAIRALKGVE